MLISNPRGLYVDKVQILYILYLKNIYINPFTVTLSLLDTEFIASSFQKKPSGFNRNSFNDHSSSNKFEEIFLMNNQCFMRFKSFSIQLYNYEIFRSNTL